MFVYVSLEVFDEPPVKALPSNVTLDKGDSFTTPWDYALLVLSNNIGALLSSSTSNDAGIISMMVSLYILPFMIQMVDISSLSVNAVFYVECSGD
mmetsp:Transcript_19817/g.35627  ORF Transcript_19817/g.35627 Transcript_19817/m.35627 type:complete len:95 (+) Transcript_19817:374-658(+)